MVINHPTAADGWDEMLKTKKRRVLLAVFLVANSTLVGAFGKWVFRDPAFKWFATLWIVLFLFVAIVVIVRPSWAGRAVAAWRNEGEREQKRWDNWQPPGFP
jgi:hypothetical protein